ncbi:hypothetical protein GCM10022389_20090 [Flavobacterium cheonanense]|uniref:DUF4194 domain-containing protein n=1 Tax=Flavobacterium cheonanense TaxID=706183 RepID=A0ABP7VUZ0_9FLAO
MITNRLLTSFLELYTLSDNTSKWSKDNFANNPPRLYRLQAIDALMKALQINCSYQEFQYGEFLLGQNQLVQSELITKIKENYTILFQTINTDEKDQSDSQFMFEMLFSYRMKLQKLTSLRDSVLEYSEYNRYPVLIIDTINNKLQADIEAIDNILAYLINPKEIHFSNQELIEKYNYPVGDLDEIDSDWI